MNAAIQIVGKKLLIAIAYDGDKNNNRVLAIKLDSIIACEKHSNRLDIYVLNSSDPLAISFPDIKSCAEAFELIFGAM